MAKLLPKEDELASLCPASRWFRHSRRRLVAMQHECLAIWDVLKRVEQFAAIRGTRQVREAPSVAAGPGNGA